MLSKKYFMSIDLFEMYYYLLLKLIDDQDIACGSILNLIDSYKIPSGNEARIENIRIIFDSYAMNSDNFFDKYIKYKNKELIHVVVPLVYFGNINFAKSIIDKCVSSNFYDKNDVIIGGKICKPCHVKTIQEKQNVVVDKFAKEKLCKMKDKMDKNRANLFNPKMPVLRSELAFILSDGLELQEVKANNYTDIPSEYWEHYGYILFKLDKPSEAIEAWKKAIASGSENQEIIFEIEQYEKNQ